MASVSSALQRIKQDLRPFLPATLIIAACRDNGYDWRERQLGPVQTIHLFVLQVLNLNTSMTHLRHLSKMATVRASAYCKARTRLPLAVLQSLLVQSSTASLRATRGGCAAEPAHPPQQRQLWCGLRAYLVDGSSTIAPDTPDSQKVFGQPKGCKSGCGFPVPKLLGLFDAFSGLLVQVLGMPLYTHEQSKVWMLHPLLGPGDLLVGDRGFCSFVHLAMLQLRQVQGLFRMHQKTIVSFRPHRKHRVRYPKAKKVTGSAAPMPRSRFVKRLGKHDQIVEWFKPATGKPRWLEARQLAMLPDSLLVREMRFELARNGQRTRCITIATTLLDPELYPREKIAELYGVRWRVETHFAQLKTILRMRKLKSKTADGVLKELVVYALVYNLIHQLMLQAAERQDVLPHRISFIDTLRWLIGAQADEPMPDLIINPYRPDRHQPRVVKDREDTYTKMTRPRAQLCKELKIKTVAA